MLKFDVERKLSKLNEFIQHMRLSFEMNFPVAVHTMTNKSNQFLFFLYAPPYNLKPVYK